MAYKKSTLISGYDTMEPSPKGLDQYEAIVAFGEAHRRCFVLTGHWEPTAALRYARAHRILSDVRIEHHVSDSSGMGRGGLDGRFLGRGADILTRTVSEAEDREYAAEDMAAVWDS